MEGLKAIADKGESPAITTEAGLKCLAAIRKTADKSGRKICTLFEALPPRDAGNKAYYKRTRLPISLQTIEVKLNAEKYNTMTEVESDLKRMVQNVKEANNKKSQAFEDAERVRKAVSNYMVKHNPAYLDRTYSAFPTPLPPSDDEEMADASDSSEPDQDKMDVDGDPEDQGKTPKKSQEEKGDDESGDESAEDDDDGDEDDESPASMPPITPAKRRGRPPRVAVSAASTIASGTRHSTRTPNKTSASSTPTPSTAKKSEEELLKLSYKDLTFQEGQEKIVEELLHKEEEGYHGPYYEAFINLPPRELKDYYQVISEPLSLRKLKKHVQGFQSKKVTTGVTPFRTWKAFEEKASLLWSNAYYYNEEGSEIYDIAKDLENFFKKQLKDAKAHINEPAPSASATKVILKSRTPTIAPPSKIILHANRSRRDDTPESPAIVVKRTKDEHRASATPVPSRERFKIKTATPAPASAASESDSREDDGDEEMEDADVDVEASDKEAEPEAEAPEEEPEPEEPPAVKLKPVSLTRYPGKTKNDANLQRVAFQTINMHNKPHQLIMSAHNSEMRQHHSYHLDGTFLNQKMRIVPKTAPGLFKNRFVRFYITADKMQLEPSNYTDSPHEYYFETILHRGVNTMEVHCIAGPPEGSQLPDGARYEVEVMSASFNVYSGY
ncbi:hypothetical protein BROUX41_005088 [Berkeleyomyces rouxiae]|uniref:uncharacterized protein n=1 Tax=Berkeleyomyces rouxiae TaxID=2035830 RepID=UPI003B7BDE7F